MAFPTMSRGESPSLYKESEEDVAIKSETSGGYELTRPRFTRAPRREFQTGWLSIPQADRNLWDTFYKTVRTYSAFTWLNQLSGEIVQVRCSEPPTIDYVGIGKNKMWNITVKMREV